MKDRTLTGVMGLVAVLALSGCTRTVGTLVLSFLTSPNTDERPLPGAGADPSQVLTIEVRVDGPGLGVLRESTRYVPGGTDLEVPAVDVGDDRIFTVTATNAGGEVLSRARSLPYDMTGDDENVSLYLSLVGFSSEAVTTMTTPRFRHTATPLPDGRILLTGGGRDVVQELDEDDRLVGSLIVPDDPVPYAEIFDPTTGRVVTDVPDCRPGSAAPRCLQCPRMGQVAGLDADGSPLFAGGEPVCRSTAAERFVLARFEEGGEVGSTRVEATSFDTPDGVLFVGGLDLTSGLPTATANLLTGATQTEVSGGLHLARYGAAAAPLPGGGGIVIGGFVSAPPHGSPAECVCVQEPCPLESPEALDCRARGEVTGSIERYDPVTRTFEELAVTLGEPRAFASATALPDGRVVIIGGLSDVLGIGGQNLPTSTIEVFDPATGDICPVGNLRRESWMHGAAAVAASTDDDRVIVVGGYEGILAFGVISSGVQVVGVGSGRGLGGDCNHGVLGEYLSDRLRVPRASATVTHMANGAFLIAGGATPDRADSDEDGDTTEPVVTDVLDVLWLE